MIAGMLECNACRFWAFVWLRRLLVANSYRKIPMKQCSLNATITELEMPSADELRMQRRHLCNEYRLMQPMEIRSSITARLMWCSPSHDPSFKTAMMTKF